MTWLLPAWALFVAFLTGCPAPTQYAVERTDVECERATRVVRRTFVELGYTITDMVEPRGSTPGMVAAKRTTADGTTSSPRVRIHCTGRGVEVQPIEGSFLPSDYEFSRAFRYSFISLAQRPDVEVPRVELGVQLLVEVIDRFEQRLDLAGEATREGPVLVRVTVRNATDRAVALDAGGVTLVDAGGASATPLPEAALDAALVPGPPADRVRRELLRRLEVLPRQTAVRFAVYPAGAYREARIAVEDVETGETDGFFIGVQ